MRVSRAAVFILLALLSSWSFTSGSARAEFVEPREEPELPSFSLTISPLHLFLPVVELTGEIRAADKVGVAAILGAGRYSDTTNGVRVSASVYEAGAQFRYYVLGDFRHGMQLGAELLYLHLSDDNLSIRGAGVAVGPFVGYKVTADGGFTFDVQLGVEVVGAHAESDSRDAGASDSSVIPLLNVNLGWSF